LAKQNLAFSLAPELEGLSLDLQEPREFIRALRDLEFESKQLAVMLRLKMKLNLFHEG